MMRYLSDEQIRLRALEPEDLEVLYRWENDSSLWEVGNTLAPFSRYVLKNYIAESGRSIYDVHQLRLMIERQAERQAIGIIDLFDFEPHANRAACGILLDPAFQGKGLGTRALRLLIRYAFDHLALHQLYAHVPEANLPSLRLFVRCGFQQTGCLKEWIRVADGFADVQVMQLLADQCRLGSLGSVVHSR